MRRQAATIDKVISDFLRDEADGSAQLDVGQSSFAQVEDCLEANAKELRDLLRRPQFVVRFRRGIICRHGNGTGNTGIRGRIHKDDFGRGFKKRVMGMCILEIGYLRSMSVLMGIVLKIEAGIDAAQKEKGDEFIGR